MTSAPNPKFARFRGKCVANFGFKGALESQNC
jgi:hypothetical protein